VQEVKPNALVLKDKKNGGLRELPFGMCVWCSGIKLNELAEKLRGALPEGTQPNVRSLTTDASLRVKGSDGTIFALGDCATIELKTAAAHAGAMLAPGERLGPAALAALLKRQSEEFPHLGEAAERVITESPSLFAKFCAADLTVGAEELGPLLASMDRGLRSLPATAQVAKQEGEFVASLFKAAGGDLETLQQGELEPFSYRHKGSLAYVGSDSAVADIPGFSILKGFFAGLGASLVPVLPPSSDACHLSLEGIRDCKPGVPAERVPCGRGHGARQAVRTGPQLLGSSIGFFSSAFETHTFHMKARRP
jgi:NADH:ubiquinone reductase (non-electrogenic)